MEPADPARRPRRRVSLQYAGAAAASWRAGGLLLRQSGVVSEPRPGGLRARLDRGALHLPRGLARGQTDVAAPLIAARFARPAVVEVLGGNAAAAHSRPDSDGADQRAARGHAVHDDPESGYDDGADARDLRPGVDVRDALSAVRNGERRADSDILRWSRLHDGDDRPARRGARNALEGGIHVRALRLGGTSDRDDTGDAGVVRHGRRAVHGGHDRPVADGAAKNGDARVLA